MKTLITIMLVLFLSPVAAQSYNKSGGYEKSLGYESSGGYEKSLGYESSGGYGPSEGYEKSGGYNPFTFDDQGQSSETHRKKMLLYDEQIRKASQKQRVWLKDRHENIENMKYIDEQQSLTGGIYQISTD